MNDLDLVSIGLIIDMYAERLNDTVEDNEKEIIAGQEEFDRF